MTLATAKARVQRITNAKEDKLIVLEEIIKLQSDALISKLGLDSVPNELEYIVVETSIARYNRLGSEGLKSEHIDVISQTFVEDLFAPYAETIASYKGTKSNRAKFL